MMPIEDILNDPHVIANLDQFMLVQGEANQWGYTYATVKASYDANSNEERLNSLARERET